MAHKQEMLPTIKAGILAWGGGINPIPTAKKETG